MNKQTRTMISLTNKKQHRGSWTGLLPASLFAFTFLRFLLMEKPLNTC